MVRLTAIPTKKSRLKGFIALYALFLAVGSLYPFSGWVPFSSLSADFLTAPWPRFITRTDLATNLFSYVPLGYACALWFSTPGHRLRGVILGVMSGTLLSFLCEAMQQLVATRIASNLDLLVNSLGALIGALLAIHHSRWLRTGAAMRLWRRRWFWQGLSTSLGLALLLVWLLSQFALVPVSGIGWLHLHLRPLDTPPESLAGLNMPWLLALFIEIAAVGTFTACLLRPGRYVGGLVLLVFIAFFTKLLVATILLKLTVVGGVFSPETLGAILLAFWLLLLPAVSRHRRTVAMACMAVLILTRLWLSQDFLPNTSFLNIVGLAKHLGAIWPVLAGIWLLTGKNRRS